jgi:hypothetical protein
LPIRRLRLIQQPSGPVQAFNARFLGADMDLLYITLIAAFIAVSIALVYAFDKLKGRP